MFSFFVTDEMIEAQTCATEEPQSDILCSSTSRYLVKDITGVGVFGKVANALNMSTSQEIKMHEAVKVLDPMKNHLVHFIAYQLLEALNALKSIGVVHSHIKPDNVMLVNHQRESYRELIIGGNLLIS
ncbi:unnamed protein product [Pleuronectes platessa]|uniref:Protein kinase domain-containing protein n=1 Tax=Pleuronectes platessa TaxID=8262 RepID=A0A9N7YBK0_PLEPL|nr:unnamed protein product [Pleuronectes platessa]